MIISAAVYGELSTYCQSVLVSGKQISIDDCEKFDVDYNLLSSIYRQLLVRRVKLLSHQIDINNVIERVNKNGELLFDIASNMGFSPYKLAKMYTEAVYGQSYQLSVLVESPAIFNNNKLHSDILRCYSDDLSSSIEIELLKQCVGREFEEILYSKLDEMQICYETEIEMRKRGKSKTPDVLLLIPMAVRSGKDNKYYIVNWIDSKGMFGDEDSFAEHQEQLHGYINRYGHGMVIYWHGCVESLCDLMDNILVTDRFPDHWMFPTGELSTGDARVLSFDQGEEALSPDVTTGPGHHAHHDMSIEKCVK